MFEATFQKALLFKNIVNAVAPLLLTEISFSATINGLEVQQMDSAHVALVELAMLPECFEHYRCDRNLEMAMSMVALQRIIKMIPNKSELRIINRERPNKAEIEFHFDCGYEAVARLSLMDLDYEKLGIPTVEFDITIDAEQPAFHRLFANLASNGDTANFEVVDGDLLITAIGDTGSFDVRLKKDTEDGVIDLTVRNIVPQLGFALKYLNKMTAATFTDRVTFDIAAEFPARITYLIEGEEKPAGALRMYLAPKLEED
jgi:proliferating cell nuclear antigen